MSIVDQLRDDMLKNYSIEDILKMATQYGIPTNGPLERIVEEIARRNLANRSLLNRGGARRRMMKE